jgi:hypothetical protein
MIQKDNKAVGCGDIQKAYQNTCNTNLNENAFILKTKNQLINRPNQYSIILPIRENIPELLKKQKNWVVWKAEQRLKPKPQWKANGKPKLNKIAIDPVTKQRGVHNKPQHWADFDTAWRAYEEDPSLSGIGYCFDGEAIIGIDLDDCIDANGEYSSLAQEAINLFGDSYIEKSPSGDGLRIFVTGDRIPKDISKPVEIYQCKAKRFVTVTGQRISKGANVIRVEAFRAWYDQIAAKAEPEILSVGGSLDSSTIHSIASNVDLGRLNHHTQALIHGAHWEKYGHDGSSVLYGVCKDMFRAGYSRDEILGLCMNTHYALAEVVERHTNSKDQDRQVKWLVKYNLNKAEVAVAAEPSSQPQSTHNDILDGEDRYCRVDLLKFVDDSHLLKRMCIQIAEETHLPINTVFLIGLAVYSSVAARKWAVLYINGKRLPIGLYVVGEQPSGTGKTRCLNSFQAPFQEIHYRTKKALTEKIKAIDSLNELEARKKIVEKKPVVSGAEEPSRLKEKSKQLNSGIFTTNATPEGLEITLEYTNGFFSAVSSEQGLFDSLLGGSYGKGTNNNDVILNGFDGSYLNSKRVTREGYSGKVVGSVACFAQPGSIEKVLNASNGTGLSERFLMLAEPHTLGTRDHSKQTIQDPEIEVEYANACRFIEQVLEHPQQIDKLDKLTISSTGHTMITDYRNQIEPHLADGGKYANISLRGAGSKIDMQIMKIAAILHLLGSTSNLDTIDDNHVKAAIGIANELLEANLRLCQEKGIMGIKAEFTAVIKYLTGRSGIKTERDIVNSLRNTQPFKDFTGHKSNLIKTTLAEMVDQRLLTKQLIGGIHQYSLGQ